MVLRWWQILLFKKSASSHSLFLAFFGCKQDTYIFSFLFINCTSNPPCAYQLICFHFSSTVSGFVDHSDLDPENYNKFLGVIQRCLHYVYHCLQPVGDQRHQIFSSTLKTFKIKFTTVSERRVLEGKYCEFPFLWICGYFFLLYWRFYSFSFPDPITSFHFPSRHFTVCAQSITGHFFYQSDKFLTKSQRELSRFIWNYFAYLLNHRGIQK